MRPAGLVDSITLVGVDKATLHEDDFIFA